MNWQPITYRRPDKLCHHMRRTTEGWALDCDVPADFVAVDEDGGHWYACGRHVQEMSTSDELR